MTPQNLFIDTLDYRDHKELYFELREKKGETLDVDFGLYPDIIKSRYLDVYEGVYAEMVYTNKFNEKFRSKHDAFRADKDDKRY